MKPSISTATPAVHVMLALLLALLAGPFSRTVTAQERLLLVGPFVEKNSSLQPGLEIGYTGERFLGGHSRFALSYSTSRFATAFGSDGLKKDKFLFSSGWHFRPLKRTDPYVKLELGYARFDREDPVLFALLDNGAPVAALLFGIERRILGDFRLYGDFGFSILHSSTVYPFVASIGVHANLSRILLP